MIKDEISLGDEETCSLIKAGSLLSILILSGETLNQRLYVGDLLKIYLEVICTLNSQSCGLGNLNESSIPIFSLASSSSSRFYIIKILFRVVPDDDIVGLSISLFFIMKSIPCIRLLEG